MNRFKYIFLLVLSISSNSCFGLDTLKEINVYPIEPRSGFEPSGLTIKNGHLYAVSDKRNTIYRLEIKEDVAVMSPHIEFDATQLGALNLDLEGVTSVGDDFYVSSEAHHRLVKVKEDGTVSWVPDGPSFFPSAKNSGLFNVFNAALEGVTYLKEGQFLMAAERQPRGLIEVQLNDTFDKVLWQKNHVLNESMHHLELDRPPDLTGLYYYKEEIFALHRNAELIHKWVKDETGVYKESGQWSFAHIVNAPENQYQSMKYGHAEGLAVDDENFYLVLDNNRQPKAKQENDARPLLIVLKR